MKYNIIKKCTRIYLFDNVGKKKKENVKQLRLLIDGTWLLYLANLVVLITNIYSIVNPKPN